MIKSNEMAKLKSIKIFREKLSAPLERSPRASSKAVSKSMKGNTAKDTKPEILLRKMLYSSGIRGYRLNWKKAPGRPDICFASKKIAIFVNGCFWHRCPRCDLPIPKTNRDFWKRKFSRNIERDRLKKKRLEESGWKVITVWECEIKDDIDGGVKKITEIYQSIKKVD